jgi:L-rhamnose mutarotase
MQRRALTMKIREGAIEEYKRRHDAIWPELNALLLQAGIIDYTIFLHESSLTLFAVLWLQEDHTVDRLPEDPLMQKWWHTMGDIMETESSGAPKTWPLDEVYHLERP